MVVVYDGGSIDVDPTVTPKKASKKVATVPAIVRLDDTDGETNSTVFANQGDELDDARCCMN